MTRFPAAGGGMEMAYTYVRDGYPADAEEGETLYHVTENRAYVYDGANWIEQTVTDHGELSGVGASDHHEPIPSGVITMWNGTTLDVPSGWTLCDGTDGTPDLRDRFVTGAGAQYSAGDTGGEDFHQLTVAEMPSHSHTYREAYVSDDTDGNNDWNIRPDDRQSDTGTTGGDEAHENRPPYYALAFIMKI